MPVKNFERLNTTTDTTTTKTLLHESIPVTGSILSGTYSDENVKNYTHGMFQSVYDYPYLSSSANHIMDFSIGFDEASVLSSSANLTQGSKKINMYNQFSQVLLGYTGSDNQVRKFESDLLLDGVGSMGEAFFVSFSRLITKDQVKKGSVSLTLGTGSWAAPFATVRTLTDSASSDVGGVASTIGGDYGILKEDVSGDAYGVVFYQAGIAVLTSSAFAAVSDFYSASAGTGSVDSTFVSASISASCDALRHRIQNVSFNNTTEINSTIYFCRAPHNKFNYSSNPTYTSAGKVQVKTIATDTPVSYITTVGLYNSSKELLATAKLSEPLRKDPTNEVTLRVRLDY